MRAVARAVVACLAGMAFALITRGALAKIVPPPLVDGHVVDTAGVLAQGDIDALNQQMEAIRLQSGYTIDAFVVKSLEGESIDDLAFDTFAAWRPGQGTKDNGVLIVVAPNDRVDRIEVGKGLEGALTDLQTDDIRREQIEPRLKAGDVRGGIAAGTAAIAGVLTGADPGTRQRPVGGNATGSDGARVIFYVIVMIVVIVIMARGRGGRGGPGGFFWFGGGGGGFGGGGGGGFGGKVHPVCRRP